MKFYRYWAREKGTVRVGDGTQEVSCVAGSNVSQENASELARDKIVKVQSRIDGNPDAFGEYERVIREDVLRVIDERNILTRTRYGAVILNSEDTFFVDIDHPPRSFWKSLFAWRGKSSKERIVAHVEDVAARAPLSEWSVRLYETRAGIRAIILGSRLAADSREAYRLMERLHADLLYASLCHTQKCFRARVTPKPYRLHCGTIKVVVPRTPEQQAELDEWIPRYEAACEGRATCRFIKQIGPPWRTGIIDLHDELTRATSGLPLA